MILNAVQSQTSDADNVTSVDEDGDLEEVQLPSSCI